MSELIKTAFHENKQVGIIYLNNPSMDNALTAAMLSALKEQLNLFAKDKEIRAVLLTSSINNFSIGLNLGECATATPKHLSDMARRLEEFLSELYNFPKPTIGLFKGLTYDVAMAIPCCVDIAIADDSAIFALTGLQNGFLPAVALPYLKKALGERVAMRYSLSTEKFGAAEAMRIGLVHEAVSQFESEAVVDHLIRSILDSEPTSQKKVKELILQARSSDTLVNEMAESLQSGALKEGVKAKAEKRLPLWRQKSQV